MGADEAHPPDPNRRDAPPDRGTSSDLRYPGMPSILVVEDEVSYQEALLAGLTREGFRVELASNGIDALRVFNEIHPDLVLLDLMLPGMPGIEVCRRMREIEPVPIIVVSALNSEADIVRGLELGAEDYIAKPFRLRELVARIRSVLRRVALPHGSTNGGPRPAPEPPRADAVVAGPCRLDFARRVVTVNGVATHLSRREFELLALLLSPPGRVRMREELLDRIWSGRQLSDTRTLDTHIRRLRVKLESDPANPRYLLTVRGVGFRFEAEEHARVDASSADT